MNHIALITEFVEQKKHAFAVSRLIMLSGVQVRQYKTTSAETVEETTRVLEAAAHLLSQEELTELKERLEAAGKPPPEHGAD